MDLEKYLIGFEILKRQLMNLGDVNVTTTGKGIFGNLEISGTGARKLTITSTDHVTSAIEFMRTGNAYIDRRIMNLGGDLLIGHSSNDGASWGLRFSFPYGGHMLAIGANRIQFRDTGLYIYSSTDGQLDLVADVLIKLNSNVEVTGRISSGTAIITGNTSNMDVSGINTLFVNPGATTTITGFTNGVEGQVLFVSAIANGQDITMVHNSGTQKVFLHTGGNETLSSEYGGWTLTCDGTNWYDTEHSKHV